MTTENNINQTNEDEISLKELILQIKEIWNYLLSKWKLIVVVGLLGGALGFAYSFTKKVNYKAVLTFSVIEKGSQGGGLSSLAGQFGFNVGSPSGGLGVFSGSNMIELLQSRNLIERTLLHELKINNKTYRLINYYQEINPPKNNKQQETKEINFPLGLEREKFSREQDSLLYTLSQQITEKKLSVSKGSKDVSIIKMSFQNEDELFAKLFTETLIDVVTDFYIKTKTKTTRDNLSVMQQQTDSTKTEYEKALEKQALFADGNRNSARQIVGVEQIKYATAVEIAGKAYAELVKNVEVLKLDLAQETPLIQIIDSPIMPLEKQGFGKTKGIILGGFLGGFLIVGWLLAGRFYRKIMA